MVQNYANFYCPQKDIHVEGTQSSMRIFVHWLAQADTAAVRYWEPRNLSRRQV